MILPRVRLWIRALLVLVTLGWDFPILQWWFRRPRVVARIARRREAMKVLVRPLVRLVKFVVMLPVRFVAWK